MLIASRLSKCLLYHVTWSTDGFDRRKFMLLSHGDGLI